MGRLLVGLIKGLVIGGGAGAALLALHLSGILGYVAIALVGATVGLICGKAPWRAETIWTPVLKMVVGLGISLGLFALGRKFLPGEEFMSFNLKGLLPALSGTLALNSAPVLAPAIGMLYGAFVEVDDGGDNTPKLEGKAKSRALPRKPQNRQLED